MNYERTVLEMLERIKTLEEKVKNLEENHEHEDLNNDKVLEVTTKPGESGRKLSRIEVMKIFREKYGFDVKKANRSEGSGIVVLRNDKQYNVKISYCRSFGEYANEEVICTGWHTLFENDLNNPKFSFFIFVIGDAAKKLHYFIFKREDIINEFKYKVLDSNKKLHFYFRVKKDGRPFEVREIEKDMSSYYNNWTVFENLK